MPNDKNQQVTDSNSTFDVAKIREDFPILNQLVNSYPLAYLDNAATTHKPQCVIDCLSAFYQTINANIHRGVHTLSMRATDAFEASRQTLQRYINAQSSKEIVFTRGTTEAINLVAHSYGNQNVKAGDEIIISEMEHHANIVPWQLLCQRTGACLKIIPINHKGELDLSKFNDLFSKRTKLVAIVYVSNSLGTINPIDDIIHVAHQHNVPVLVDGTQAGPHLKIDVQALSCDFLTLSAHKMYGPTGVGALYAKYHLLEKMPPYQAGGEMINYVSLEKSDYAPPPTRFEAGTMPIASVVAWSKGIDYIQNIGITNIANYEQALLNYATEKISQLENIKIYGEADQKTSILAFNLGNIHAHDVGTICDQHGVAIRSGHHCTMPIMQHFQVAATARASFAFYNTFTEIDQLITALQHAEEIFG